MKTPPEGGVSIPGAGCDPPEDPGIPVWLFVFSTGRILTDPGRSGMRVLRNEACAESRWGRRDERQVPETFAYREFRVSGVRRREHGQALDVSGQ
jgi:hypothetical protein